MTGSEISAENPGLTARSRCSPEFNPFWTVAGLQGVVGAAGSLGVDPSPC